MWLTYNWPATQTFIVRGGVGGCLPAADWDREKCDPSSEILSTLPFLMNWPF